QGTSPADGRLRVGFRQRLLPGLGRAHVVHGQVGGDPADPGAEGPRQVEPAEGLMCAQEGLLDDVVRHVMAADDANGGGVDPTLVALHDLVEGKKVPVACPSQEVGLGGIQGAACVQSGRHVHRPLRYAPGGGPIPAGAGRPKGRPRDAYSRTLMTTRRFWARCSRVLLSTMGLVSPYEMTSIRLRAMPCWSCM